MTVVRTPPLGAIDDLVYARVLLDQVTAGRPGPVLRIYRPEPTAAFGTRDRFLPGFDAAVQAARDCGFTPALRTLGGRIAAYHPGSLVVDHIAAADTYLHDTVGRFTRFGEFYAEALRGLGADARVGQIPGEYCPGEHSINVAGRIKAVGTAQRVAQGGWLFSSSFVVTDPDPIRRVLTAVQDALEVDWDPQTGGAMSELYPDLTVDAVETAVLEAYGEEYDLRFVEDPLTADSRQALDAHRPRHIL